MAAGDDIQQLKVSAYTIPTDFPESDGTLEWDSTTLIVAEIFGMGNTGLGYTYADASAAEFIQNKLKPALVGKYPMDVAGIHQAMLKAIRNEGQCGLAMTALSAVDMALWDLKANVLNLPLCDLIGRVRDEALIYGSGGFTSYPDERLEVQLGNWANNGFSAVKIKIGREPDKDIHRIGLARKAIGEKVALFVDANGAFNARQALDIADQFSQYNVSWFEEPVSSDDLPGLQFIRQQINTKIRIAAGEYGYGLKDFLALLQNNAVDVLQADATRCGGITGFLTAGQLAETFHRPFSFHCAPAFHLHAALCLPQHWIGEYFHDHVRIENLLFDGMPQPEKGYLKPNLSQPGLGLIFKHKDAERYKVS
jgi:L-alanine-DL-glutamate epimerase-like enolase superfamily enzyme